MDVNPLEGKRAPKIHALLVNRAFFGRSDWDQMLDYVEEKCIPSLSEFKVREGVLF